MSRYFVVHDGSKKTSKYMSNIIVQGWRKRVGSVGHFERCNATGMRQSTSWSTMVAKTP